MPSVAVRILHPEPAGVGPLERLLLDARSATADRLAAMFRDAGADDVAVRRLPVDPALSFGSRLRAEVAGIPSGGLVVLGSGAIVLATAEDVAVFVAVAASGHHRALANNRYSADAIAVGDATTLANVPDLPADNALPRWLEEVAGFAVEDLRSRWHLAMDLDSPLDVVLAGLPLPTVRIEAVRTRLARVAAVAADRRAELVVAGRTSAATLAWLERETASRVRALVEERGLRASAPEATSDGASGRPARTRPPRSALGIALDHAGPEALGAILGELGDAAVVDTRVLLAHRLGADERPWPVAEDRFASDLLLPERIDDPWLRDLTASALEARIPVLLGGHSLVGPGIRLVLAPAGSGTAPRGRPD